METELTPIKLKMKYEKETGDKIFILSDDYKEYAIQIKKYINWLEESIIKNN